MISYSVSYLDSSTDNICSQAATIPVSACQEGVCEHRFHVSTSFCHSLTNVTVVVRTTSLLGTGLPSNPVTISTLISNIYLFLGTAFSGILLAFWLVFSNILSTFCLVSVN